MIHTLAIANFRSIHHLVLPLGQLNVVTGANGSGKSNLYRGLRLLAETAQGNVVGALAREGGLSSVLWAGPEEISRRMKSAEVPVQGTVRKEVVRLRLGFADDDLGYAISMGFPQKSVGLASAFDQDPEIKTESIWAQRVYRSACALVERKKAAIFVKNGRTKNTVSTSTPLYESMLTRLGQSASYPEVLRMRELIGNWRFYDYFRTDRDAPARKPQLGTRTPVLHHDGHDLAAALQTIREVGDADLLAQTIDDAFPGSVLKIEMNQGYFEVGLKQPGMLRALAAPELSDGTLRFLLLSAALLTPRPPTLMVLNEPENSLHSDLIPALARLMINASRYSQLWVVSHSQKLVRWLSEYDACNIIELEKTLGQTFVKGQGDPAALIRSDVPAWHWPD